MQSKTINKSNNMKINTIYIDQIKLVSGGFCMCGLFNNNRAQYVTASNTEEDCHRDCCYSGKYDTYQYSDNDAKYSSTVRIYDCRTEKIPPFFDLENSYLDGFAEQIDIFSSYYIPKK